jgi:antitoxin component YwqK of YwqJK toxin-antitoxin module
MKKLYYLIVLVLAFNFSSFAQDELTLENPTLRLENTVYSLGGFDLLDRPIIDVTMYHNNGKISQMGSMIDKKPDGTWLMYDINGILISKMEYNCGKKEVLINYTERGEVVIHYLDNKPHKQIQIAYLD